MHFDVNLMTLKFSTTQFIGPNKESSKIHEITELHIDDNSKIEAQLTQVNLYPQKVHNVGGREIVLSIFNYMPYTLWKEVVSKLIKNFMQILINFLISEWLEWRASQLVWGTSANAIVYWWNWELGVFGVLQANQLLAAYFFGLIVMTLDFLFHLIVLISHSQTRQVSGVKYLTIALEMASSVLWSREELKLVSVRFIPGTTRASFSPSPSSFLELAWLASHQNQGN
jgi:hypothetical protein